MHIDYEKNGYLVAREFFDYSTIQIMKTYWDLKWGLINYNDEERKKVHHSTKMYDDFGIYDRDVAYTYNFYGDPLSESLELIYGQNVCNLLKVDLLPTYTYTRIYEKDSTLTPHVDRESCELSATCPILISDDSPSTIFIANYKWFDISPNVSVRYTVEEMKQKGDYSEINLYPGDVMFYNGVERYHWREPLKSNLLIQFFMHFVFANGKYTDFVFDKRPDMGFPDKYSSLIKR